MQESIVAAIVLYAAWAVARRYAPLAWKTACTDMTLRTAKRFGWYGLARVMLKTKQPASSACASGCDTCGGCSPTGKTPSGEFVVNLERLSRKYRA